MRKELLHPGGTRRSESFPESTIDRVSRIPILGCDQGEAPHRVAICGIKVNADDTGRVRSIAGLRALDEIEIKISIPREKYADALGGRMGVLRVFDIHDMWSHEVEDLIKQYNPAVVLFDMVDKIKFGGETNNNGQRTDQLLEAMYQWARFMGVKHDTAVIATSQLSADADGVSYPTLPQLKDSKTGKQGAADVIITIGTLNDPVLVDSRYIGTTKNKKVRTGQRASPNTEVFFDGQRCRYKEAGV